MTSDLLTLPTIDEIRVAAQRIEGHAHRTPVMTCRALDELSGASLFFKCENFQRGGAFKFRGAYNAVFSLTDSEAARGVVTHSSGNHAAALALAAKMRGVPAHIVMPDNTSAAKKCAVEAYGGRITWCEPTLEARHDTAARILRETGGVLIHPYDDPRVIAGQGTIALELHEQVPRLDAVVVPVSGGGIISGIALANTGICPTCNIYGAEPAAADDAARSIRSGKIEPAGTGNTLADGLRATLSPRTFHAITTHVRDILTATESEIIDAMRLIWERIKIIVEPSSAIGLAVVLRNREVFANQRVAVVLTGGNVDLDNLPWMPAPRTI